MYCSGQNTCAVYFGHFQHPNGILLYVSYFAILESFKTVASMSYTFSSLNLMQKSFIVLLKDDK